MFFYAFVSVLYLTYKYTKIEHFGHCYPRCVLHLFLRVYGTRAVYSITHGEHVKHVVNVPGKLRCITINTLTQSVCGVL